ncbi:hypothetical protein ACFY84_29490 [Streptomyces sp. NPDC012438]|uniref:hypothetical protein n=1 Tax=Streptomyces sp. NPDC012438 TaxID=3364833 RepID=UPI0036E6B327
MPGSTTPTLITTAPTFPRVAHDNRLPAAATLGLIAVFAILGAILALAGMTLGAIVQLLACCAAVGAVTAGAVASGRRLAALLSSALGNLQ